MDISVESLAQHTGLPVTPALKDVFELLGLLGAPRGWPNLTRAALAITDLCRAYPWLVEGRPLLRRAAPSLRKIAAPQSSHIGVRLGALQHGFKEEHPNYSAFAEAENLPGRPLQRQLLAALLAATVPSDPPRKEFAKSHWAPIARLVTKVRLAGGKDLGNVRPCSEPATELQIIHWIRQLAAAGASEPAVARTSIVSIHALGECLVAAARARREIAATVPVEPADEFDLSQPVVRTGEPMDADLELQDSGDEQPEPGSVPEEDRDPRIVFAADPVPPGEDPKPIAVDRSTAERRYHLWQSRSLVTYQWDLLTPEEAERACGWLHDECCRALDSNDLQTAETCVALLLSVATATRTDALHFLPCLDERAEEAIRADPDANGILVGGGEWIHPVPRWRKFYGSSTVFEGTAQAGTVVALPLPNSLSELLRRVRAVRPPDKGRLLQSEGTSFRIAANELLARMRASGLSRVTPRRLSRVLFAAIYRITCDLPLTMLASGIEVAESEAGLHYLNVPAHLVRAAYAEAVSQIFRSSAEADTREPPRIRLHDRVGCFLQASDDEVRELVNGLYGRILGARKLAPSRRGLIAELNATTAYVAYSLIAGSGHRPTNSIGRLTVRDFDPEARMCLLADKISHEGLRQRLASFGSAFAQHLIQYRTRLRGFEKDAERFGCGALAAAIRRARAGKGALLIASDPRGAAVPITARWLKSSAPPGWGLPTYALRHRLTRKLREAALAPYLISVQLGHLEFGVQPFGPSGAIAPTDFALRASGSIDSALAGDHWRALPDAGDTEPWTTSLPRRLDGAYIRSERALLRREQKHLRAQASKRRAGALGHEVEAMNAVETALELAGKPPYRSTVEVEQVLREIIGADSTLAQLAFARLRQRLERGDAARSTALPARQFGFNPEPSPFLVGSLAAYAQLKAWRRWFLDAFPSESPSQDDDLLWAATKVLTAAVLFGDVFSREQLERLRVAIPSARLAQRIPGTLVIEAQQEEPDEAPEFDLLGPVASLAAGDLLKRASGQALPPLANIDACLASLLPTGLGPRKERGSALDCLLHLAAIGARFEQAGCVRASHTGLIPSVALTGRDAGTLIEGLPSGSFPHTTVAVSTPAEPKLITSLPVGAVASTFHVAVRQYRELRAILHVVDGQPKRLPGSTAPFAPDARRSTVRRAIRDAVTRFIQGESRSSIVRALAGWAHSLLTIRRPSGRFLRLGTVYRYATRIGRTLVALAHDFVLMDLDEHAFIELYEACLSSKPSRHRRNAAERILEFHRFLQEAGAAPRIDRSEIWSMSGMVRPAEASFVGEAQIKAAMALLGKDVAALESIGDLDQLRIARATRLFGMLLSRTGCRPGEIHGLHHCDVSLYGTGVLVLIRPTSLRQLKSFSAARPIMLSRLDSEERGWLVNWIAAERARLGAEFTPDLPLFGDRVLRQQLLERSDLMERAGLAVRVATGCANAHLYWLRHAHATRKIDALLRDPAAQLRDVPAVRALRQISVEMGHAQVTTTLCHYAHAHPLWRTPVGGAPRLSDTQTARLSGMTESNLRKKRSRSSIARGDLPLLIGALAGERKSSFRWIDSVSVGDPLPWTPSVRVGTGLPSITSLAGVVYRLTQGSPAARLVEGVSITWRTLRSVVEAIARIDTLGALRIVPPDVFTNIASDVAAILPFDWLPTTRVLAPSPAAWQRVTERLRDNHEVATEWHVDALHGLGLLVSRRSHSRHITVATEHDVSSTLLALQRLGLPREHVKLICYRSKSADLIKRADLLERFGALSDALVLPPRGEAGRRYSLLWSGPADGRRRGDRDAELLMAWIVRLHMELRRVQR